jgi:hypothetical protein
MGWISDVREELKGLDTSRKKLRNFGLTVGTLFLLLAAWLFFRSAGPWVRILLCVAGMALIGGGLLLPHRLKFAYRCWMGLAYAIGWPVARITLGLLFFCVLGPIGLIARAFGKEFLDIAWGKKKDSYWIPKNSSESNDYEKMY